MRRCAASRRRRASGSAPSTRTSFGRTTTGSAVSAIPPPVRADGPRSLHRVHRDRARDRARRRSASGLPTGRTIQARTISHPVRATARGLEHLYARAARGDAPPRRVQVLRARLLQHRPPRLGHSRTDLPAARPAGESTRRHGPSSAGNERRADRRPASCRGPARRLSLQQQQVRGRRSHRRLDRPVRVVQDHARDRPWLQPRERRIHDRPVAQHRGKDRRDAAIGDEHPDRLRQGAAGRRRPTRRRPG